MSFPKVYTVNGPSSTSATSLPSWITTKPKSTRDAQGHRKRVKTQRTLGQLELIQDFTFPEAAIRIKTTEDGLHAIATGCYKPMIKVWDLEELTVKFERVTDAENVDFQILSSDWTKSLHLQRDRSLALHTQSGLHYSVRLPVYGRCLGYHAPSADALVGCTGAEVFRFNLEEGRYMTPIQVAQKWGSSLANDVEGVNVVDVNPRHGLWSFGLDGGGGAVEFWDPRSRSALTRLNLPSSTLLPAQDGDSLAPIKAMGVTALKSHATDGLSMAVGTSTGHTLLYDLRSPTPFAVKDQGYGEPIRSVDWLKGGGAQEDGGRVISADSKVIKIWSKDEPSSNQLSLHPPASLVDLHAVPNSGLMLVACDSPTLSTYYVPEIGPAPKWAGFLDSVTEELADDPSTGAGKGAYSDFKFIDKAELETLGLSHLVGTSALKPYMHGYFLSLKLYTTARLIANPNSYAEHREKVVADRLAAKAESRIRARKEQPKVNKALAERIRRAEEREAAVEKRKREKRGLPAPDADADGQAKKSGGLLADDRFKEIFENPDFEVDQESREFALLNPATANNNALRKTAVQDEEDESDRESSDLEDSDEASEEDQEMDQDDDEEDEEDDDDGADSDDSDDGDLQQYDPRNIKRNERFSSQRAGPSRPKLVVGSDGRSSQSQTFGQRLSSSGARSNGKAAAAIDKSVLSTRRSADGGMEMSFIPSSKPSRGDGAHDNDQDEYSGGSKRVNRKIEKFGAGMERGQEEDEGNGRGGRTRRRDVGRSASKNAFRRR